MTMLQMGAPAAIAADLDPWTLIQEASLIVQGVIALLVFMSVACWFVVGAKWLRLSQVRRGNAQFLRSFWHREDPHAQWTPQHLERVYGQSTAWTSSPIAQVFRSGYAELARLASAQRSAFSQVDGEPFEPSQDYAEDIQNVERALQRTATGEMSALEARLPVLATTASAAPFIGLFGTVWGIMNTFMAIAGQNDTGLAVVLPGISEALIATAIGLAAAIPAVMAYNYFVRRLRLVEVEIEAFASDYLNIVRRHFLRD